MELAGFLFLMFALKIPLGLLLWLVWWAIRQTPEEAGERQGDGDGGSRVQRPRQPFPHRPRRGPHGEPALAAPPRVRTTVARSRTPER